MVMTSKACIGGNQCSEDGCNVTGAVRNDSCAMGGGDKQGTLSSIQGLNPLTLAFDTARAAGQESPFNPKTVRKYSSKDES